MGAFDFLWPLSISIVVILGLVFFVLFLYIVLSPLAAVPVKVAPDEPFVINWKPRTTTQQATAPGASSVPPTREGGEEEELVFRKMKKSEIGQVSRLMVDAFLPYPAFEFLTDDIPTRRRMLEFIFPGVLTAALQYGYCWVAVRRSAPDDILGELTFYPEGVDLSPRDLILNGIATFPFRFGLSMTMSLLDMVMKQDGWKQSRYPKSRGLVYVDFLSTAVRVHGQGIGKRLLETTQAAVQRQAKVPLVLNTWDPNEVQFYQNRGYHLVDRQHYKCDRNGKNYTAFWLVKPVPKGEQ